MRSARLRRRMVETQLEARDIRDPAVLDAMASVPRERFVSPAQEPYAYDDGPLPIGEGQTISQPYIVACMAESLALGPEDRVLDVGTGCGYAAAILGRIAAEVWSIERIDSLARAARDRLHRLGYDNVHVIHGDGMAGWPDAAPFDAIQVAAATARVPETLQEQLAEGGRLVLPVGRSPYHQMLVRITRLPRNRFSHEEITAVRFVPLLDGTENTAG